MIVELFNRVRPFTVVDDVRLGSLWGLATVLTVPGDLVECGVAQGGSAAVLGAAMAQDEHAVWGDPKRHLWLYDSCQGLPAPTDVDGPHAPAYVGANQTSPERIAEAMALSKLPRDRWTLRPGWFLDTFAEDGPEKIALLHIDADWYDSVWLCLERWGPLVVDGGIIVLDDYGFWPGCRAACHQWLGDRKLSVELHRCGDQAWWVV